MIRKIACPGIAFYATSILFATSAQSIEVDGELEDAAWQQAIRYQDFKVSQPLSFETPPNETQVLVTSNDRGIYVGFINQQQVDESVDSRSLRDAEINSDYNEVIIDFDGQSVRAFGFKVSRGGAVQDSIWSDENRESTDWDGEWQHAVEVDDDEWTSEIFIPWSIVSMMAGEADTRKVNVYFSRWHQGKNMRFSFPAIDRSQKTFIGNFHPITLAFKQASSLDIFPYVSFNQDLERKKDETRVGVDIFWKPTTAQQVNATLNPDFGQVESDDLVVNFSAVETFFSEKRPFFRENHDLFDLQGPENLRLVHTPRIGGEADIEDAPANEINAAARYNYIGESFDFGVLSAFEDDNPLVTGREYFAARAQLKYETGRIGMLLTHTERPSLNRKADISVADFLLEPIDELRLTGQIIRSDIQILTTNTTDSSWWVGAEYEPSDEWSHEFHYYDFGQHMDVSDFGFVERVNRQQWTYEVSRLWTEVSGDIRDIEWSWYFDDKENAQNHDLPWTLATSALFNFDSTRAIEIEFEYQEKGIDDLLTRGNNPVKFPAIYKTSLVFYSSKNSALTFAAEVASGVDFFDGRVHELEFAPRYQISENAAVSLALEWEKRDSWVIWDEDNTIEEFVAQELTLGVNFNAVFAERHELRLKLESVGLEARALNEFEVDSLGNLTLADEPPDSFSLSEFAMQLRYRYEISSLSELFIVYSRGGEFEEERLGYSVFSLLNRSVNRDEDENLIVKLKMHF